MAYGKVGTGFSCPWVATYSVSGGVVSYSDPMRLARGVSVSIKPDMADSDSFYADNIEAEEDSGTFTGGELTLEVDGLLRTAEQFIFGLEDADSDGFIAYGDTTNAPYVGFGFIKRFRSGGVTYYTPYIITKCKFVPGDEEAETSEDTTNWQTQELTANIFRDDSTSSTWKLVGEDYTTEDLAEDALKAKLGYSDSSDESEE